MTRISSLLPNWSANSLTSRSAVSRMLSRFMRSRYSIRFFLASPAMFFFAWSWASWMYVRVRWGS